jgi:hypothetical protein
MGSAAVPTTTASSIQPTQSHLRLLPNSVDTYMPRGLAVYRKNIVAPLAHSTGDVVASQWHARRARALPRLSSYDSMTNQRNIKCCVGANRNTAIWAMSARRVIFLNLLDNDKGGEERRRKRESPRW